MLTTCYLESKEKGSNEQQGNRMPKYTVAVTEVIEYLVEVEADNEDDAGEAGVEIIVESENRDAFFVCCREREVDGVNLISSG